MYINDETKASPWIIYTGQRNNTNNICHLEYEHRYHMKHDTFPFVEANAIVYRPGASIFDIQVIFQLILHRIRHSRKPHLQMFNIEFKRRRSISIRCKNGPVVNVWKLRFLSCWESPICLSCWESPICHEIPSTYQLYVISPNHSSEESLLRRGIASKWAWGSFLTLTPTTILTLTQTMEKWTFGV